MKLAISNIGWESALDEQVYGLMQKYGFSGIEIAPTVWVPEMPYESEQVEKAKEIANDLRVKYGFQVCSMQSILFGRTEHIFGIEDERDALFDYMINAIDYAAALECRNLVFGCPRNRSFPQGWTYNEHITNAIELAFFQRLGDYAESKGTVLAMEANPPIYNTNYMNTTYQALELVDRMDSAGFLLNLDVGTMVENVESVESLRGKVSKINHVHISEPKLMPIKRRPLHTNLANLLREEGYDNYISIEVGKNNLGDDPLKVLEAMMAYVAKVFG